jgi:2-dehydropantoate 2-reductase
MKILILGAGGIGGYYGGVLMKGGADVEFLVRPKRAAQLAATGLVVRIKEGDIVLPARTVQAGEIRTKYDAIVMAPKSYDLDEAMDAVAPGVGGDCAILPLMNGIKHIDTLSARFGARHVLGGTTLVSANLQPNGEIVKTPIAVNAPSTFGELDGSSSDRCAALDKALTAGGAASAVSTTIVAGMWAKLMAVGSLASVATLCRSRAAAICAAPASKALVEAALADVIRVGAVEGHIMPDGLRASVRAIFATPGSPYAPSMFVDMENGRRTEGEHIIGDLVERAGKHKLDVPILTAALCNLQAYEINRAAKTG